MNRPALVFQAATQIAELKKPREHALRSKVTLLLTERKYSEIGARRYRLAMWVLGQVGRAK